jgi:aminoglycoside phosphotransferase (APT) family kinase protein
LVLNWELCTLGDPLADLGCLLATGPRPTTPQPTESGRSLEALGFWHALGLWKIAIICEGVRRRALDDERNAATGGVPDAQIVGDLIAQALLVAADAGL